DRGVGLNHHALRDRHGAGRDGLGRLLLLDQAHAAVAGDRQALVVAEARDLAARELAGLQHRDAGRHLDLDAVDGHLWHGSSLLRRLTPAGVLVDAPLHLGPEMADQTLHRPGRRIAQGADRVALYLTRDFLEHVDLIEAGVATDHAFHHPPHPARALAARRALAAALVHVEPAQPRDGAYDVGRLVHHDDGCRAKAGTDLAQAVEIHQHRVA